MTHVLASLVLLIAALWVPGTVASSGDPVPVQRVLDVARLPAGSVSLTDYFAILEDPGKQLGLAEVQAPEVAERFKAGQPPARSLNFGVTPSAYWLRLKLTNSSSGPVRLMLEISYPRLAKSVQFWQPDGGGRYAVVDTGYGKPFSSRAYKHHHFVFPVEVPVRSGQEIFLRFESPNNLEIPAVLWSEEAFFAYERTDYTIQAAYYGIVLAMAAFNLLIFVVLRDVNYLLYVIFICVAGLTFAANNGLAIEFIWGNSPYWTNIAHTVGYLLSVSLMMTLMRRMVPTRELVPRLDFLLRIMIVLSLALIGGLFYSFNLFVRPVLAMLGLDVLLVLVIGIACAIRRDRGAYFFLLAFSAICIGGVMSSLRALGVLPTNLLTTEGVQVGSAVHMLLLAFALADRYNRLRREKASAQRAALEAQTLALGAEQKVTEALRQSERMLEGMVSRRTAELSESIDKLTRTQSELVQAEKLASLGSLVAGVAHELNTPIGVALTSSSALEDAARSVQAELSAGSMKKSTLKDFIDNAMAMSDLIARSCARAARLIASFKQIAVDQTSEQRRVFDLKMLVEDNVGAVRSNFPDVPWDIAVDIPADVSCDSYPGPLGQAVGALVGNALVHAFEGRAVGCVTISACVDGGMVELTVADDGRGMSAEVLAHAFDPFFTTRMGRGGTGLGLSIALNIVRGVLGGSLTAHSIPEQGTRFVARFPVSAPVATAGAPA